MDGVEMTDVIGIVSYSDVPGNDVAILLLHSSFYGKLSRRLSCLRLKIGKPWEKVKPRFWESTRALSCYAIWWGGTPPYGTTFANYRYKK